MVGDAKIVDVTFTNGDRLRANVTAVDPYIDIAVLKIIETQNNTIDQAQAKAASNWKFFGANSWRPSNCHRQSLWPCRHYDDWNSKPSW